MVEEEEISRVHFSLLSQFVMKIYNMFLSYMQEIVKRDREEKPIVFNVEEMGASGKAKVRHVGGWVV